MNALRFLYTNYKHTTKERTVIPLRVYYGCNEYHPNLTWLLDALDVDKNATRTFDLTQVRGITAYNTLDPHPFAPPLPVPLSAASAQRVETLRATHPTCPPPRIHGFRTYHGCTRCLRAVSASYCPECGRGSRIFIARKVSFARWYDPRTWRFASVSFLD